MFGYECLDTEKGLFVGTVFPDLEHKFYMNMEKDVRTNAKKASGESVQVDVKVVKLLDTDEIAEVKPKRIDEEAYIIIARSAH
jgi:hypothetical protein